MPWHLLFLVAPLFLTVPLAVWLLVYLYRRHGFYDFPLMLLISAATVWAAGYGLELTLTTFEAKMSVLSFEYVGIALVPLGWLLLGLQLNEQLHRIKPWMIALLLVIPLASIIQVFLWQSPWNTFWSSRSMVRYGSLNLLTTTFGPGLWTQVIYSYLVQLVGAALLLASAFRASRLYIRQRVPLVLALILPWAANIVYIFKLTDVPIDFTPLCIVVSGLLLVVGVFRYGLGDLIPVAREKIFSEMKEGVMLFDNRRRLIDANTAALRLLGTGGSAIGRSAEALFSRHNTLLKLFNAEEATEELLYTGFDNKVVRVTTEDIGPASQLPCRMLVFNDLSIGSRIETTLRLVVESTSAETGEGFFRSLARSLALALGAKHAFVGVLDESGQEQVTTLAFWSDGQFLDNFTYPLAGSPCSTLLHQRTCIIVDTVQQDFPNDVALVRLGVTNYIGTRLVGFDKAHIGVLVIMNDEPFSNAEASASALEVFAIRAAAELEREHANARLHESEERYRRIVETTRDGLCVVDAEGRIEFLNEPMARMAGREKTLLIGEPLRDQFDIQSHSHDPLSLDNDTIEVRLIPRDGRKIWAAVSKTVIPEADHKVGGALMIFTDITESRSLEEQNARIQLQLQHAQKLESLGVLAGGIAHDFNNLLVPILGYVDLIQERVRNDGPATEYLARMREAGTKLADLCNQMLTYSGKGQFVKRALDLNEALERLKELIRASTAKSLVIDYDLTPGIAMIRGDETQLDQIVINLVINASEAMIRQKTGHIAIATGEEFLDADALKGMSNGESIDPGPYVYVEVADEGTGIAEQDVSRLFEPFFTTKFTGRGLGMAVVFGIVKGHHGAIRVTSTPGRGTRIRICFPASSEARKPSQTAGHAPVSREARGLVLVVDDEDMVRNTVCNMLESAGYEPITAQDGKLGYTAFMECEDLLVACIIDITMPELDGYGLLEKIQAQRPHIPVVLVSGYQMCDFEGHPVDRTHVTFLQKPFDSGELIDAIAGITGSR